MIISSRPSNSNSFIKRLPEEIIKTTWKYLSSEDSCAHLLTSKETTRLVKELLIERFSTLSCEGKTNALLLTSSISFPIEEPRKVDFRLHQLFLQFFTQKFEETLPTFPIKIAFDDAVVKGDQEMVQAILNSQQEIILIASILGYAVEKGYDEIATMILSSNQKISSYELGKLLEFSIQKNNLKIAFTILQSKRKIKPEHLDSADNLARTRNLHALRSKILERVPKIWS